MKPRQQRMLAVGLTLAGLAIAATLALCRDSGQAGTLVRCKQNLCGIEGKDLFGGLVAEHLREALVEVERLAVGRMDIEPLR